MMQATAMRIADMPAMRSLSVDDLVKLRPDIGDLIVGGPVIGPVIGPFVPGGGTPAPISTALPAVPADVRPGDLIKAEDWNAVLARLRALDGVLTALAQGTAQLTGRVNDLAGRIPTPTTPQVAAKPEHEVLVDFLGSRAVREAIANQPEILAAIGNSQEVVNVVAADPDLIRVSVLNKAAGPVGPDVEGGSPVMLGVNEAENAALQEKVTAIPMLASMVNANKGLSDALGFADAPVVAAGNVAVAKAGVAKAGAAKAGGAQAGAVAGAADVAKAGKAEVPGGG